MTFFFVLKCNKNVLVLHLTVKRAKLNFFLNRNLDEMCFLEIVRGLLSFGQL